MGVLVHRELWVQIKVGAYAHHTIFLQKVRCDFTAANETPIVEMHADELPESAAEET